MPFSILSRHEHFPTSISQHLQLLTSPSRIAVAAKKVLDDHSMPWAQNPGAGGDHMDRPPSTASLHSSGSSKVSSSRSGPAPPISSGSKIKRQCKHIGGFPTRQCGNMTSEGHCKNHR
jgi:hypothetical protein